MLISHPFVPHLCLRTLETFYVGLDFRSLRLTLALRFVNVTLNVDRDLEQSYAELELDIRKEMERRDRQLFILLTSCDKQQYLSN